MSDSSHKISLAGILIASGIVFGDIGTSPLYVFQAITGGGTRIAPDFILDEINNHFTEIVDKTRKSKSELQFELKQIVGRIKFIPAEEIPMIHIKKAIAIVWDIDIDDTLFVALHLFKKHKIWTGDKVLINGLKSKGYDICVTTTELKTKMYKK